MSYYNTIPDKCGTLWDKPGLLLLAMCRLSDMLFKEFESPASAAGPVYLDVDTPIIHGEFQMPLAVDNEVHLALGEDGGGRGKLL